MKHRKQLVAVFLLLLFASISSAEFIVQTIYFQPTNAPAFVDAKAQIADLMHETQEQYANEMERHGFGRKTFRTERDATNQVIVHHVIAKHNTFHYVHDTWDKVAPELPDKFDTSTPPWSKQDSVRVIIIGGITSVNSIRWGIGWPRHSNRYGGTTFMIGKGHNFTMGLIFHEIGHCFGLYHREGAKDGELSLYEARWLDKHYHFNNNNNNFTYPKRRDQNPSITNIGGDFVNFEMGVRSEIGLHQAQIFRKTDIIVLAWDYLNGEREHIISFEVERHRWSPVVVLQIMDTRGNYRMVDIDVNLPPDRQPTNKNPKLDDKEPEIKTEIVREKTPEDIDKQTERSITPKNKLTTTWATLKMRR